MTFILHQFFIFDAYMFPFFINISICILSFMVMECHERKTLCAMYIYTINFSEEVTHN